VVEEIQMKLVGLAIRLVFPQ